jgi:protein-serine/threonine kinase
MLAGYLPFDDDPANPEGDNINLLYKYIVNTPLTFPEYVTPHARDLLRRILVPNPRKRADLFEVARHSWLSEYAHVVEFITSSTTTPGEIQNTTVPAEEFADAPGINRSASVREPSSKTKPTAPTTVGGLANKHGKIDQEAEADYARAQRDAKRRTVQVEYVAPTTQTQRGEPSTTQPAGGRSRVRSTSQGPIEVADTSATSPKDKPLPRDPPVSKETYKTNQRSQGRSTNAPPARPSREARSTSDNVYMTTVAGAASGRPPTGGSIGAGAAYGRPVPPSVAGTNVHGSIQQPNESGDLAHANTQGSQGIGRPGVPPKFAKVTGFESDGAPQPMSEVKGHKRSSTIGDISSRLLGRSGSIFGGKKRQREQQGEKSKKYPPVSMANPMSNESEPRPSMDSRVSGRRSASLAFGRKRSGSITGSQTSQEKQSRRFSSLIPNSFSLKAIGIGKDYGPPPDRDSQQDLPIQDPPQVDERGRYVEQEPPRGNTPFFDGMYDKNQRGAQEQASSSPVQHQRYHSAQYDRRPNAVPSYMQQSSRLDTGSDSSVDQMHRRQVSAPYQPQFSESEGYDGRRVGDRPNRVVLQKNKKNFSDAYGHDPHDHTGSSGAAKRVMDFFRRRGRARGGEER